MMQRYSEHLLDEAAQMIHATFNNEDALQLHGVEVRDYFRDTALATLIYALRTHEGSKAQWLLTHFTGLRDAVATVQVDNDQDAAAIANRMVQRYWHAIEWCRRHGLDAHVD